MQKGEYLLFVFKISALLQLIQSFDALLQSQIDVTGYFLC